MMSLLHLISYIGGLAAFLFVTLSLGKLDYPDAEG
jgi:hypothetical protein